MEIIDSCKYVMHARLMVMEDKYDKAFDILLAAFERIPSLIPIYEEEFCAVLLMLNAMLAESNYNRLTDIFNNFTKALKIFPNNPLLLNDIGKYLYKYGYHKEALDQFEEVLQISPTYANVEKNINSVKNLLVERWHFRMLNDNLRNESYRKAIRQMISDEDRVLDVGTGTGLLGIYAREAGASKVVACDGSKVMCNLASNIIHANSIKNITIVNKMSGDLTPLGLGGTCSKLVTEMFDAGLFGEHVLFMLADMWVNMLNDKAEVVPNSAEFFVMGAQCEHLSKNYKLGTEAKSLLNINSLNVHCPKDEPYDSEDVHLIKDIKYLTEPKSLLKINFNNLADIVKHIESTDPYEVELVAKKNGQMNVVIGWFNLYLTDSITITTDPRAPDRANAWQQAIFTDYIPKIIQENEVINLKFHLNGGHLRMVPSSDTPITRMSIEMIRFLNDTVYMKMISDSFFVAYVHLAQIKEISECNIVDLCPFPLFGLLMLKRGAKSLTYTATNEHDKNFILKIMLENGIEESKVSFLPGDDWGFEVFDKNCYHAIFNHSLELCGDVHVGRNQVIPILRKNNKLLHGGIFLPQKVKLVVQLVSSHWLDLNNKLNDKNVSNYAMANYVNRYKVTQNFDIDCSTLKYVPLSEPITFCDCADTNGYEEKSVKVISDGYANAILCWYSIEMMELTQEISTNRPNSFMNEMLFLTYSSVQLIAGNSVKIIQHKDKDGNFKLVMKPI